MAILSKQQNQQERAQDSRQTTKRKPAAAQSALPATPFHTLQRSIGNRAVGARAARAGRGLVVQPSLMLGPVDTPAEREADTFAQMLPPSRPQAAPVGDAQAAQVDTIVRRAAAPRATGAAALGSGAEVAPEVQERIEAARGGGMALDHGVRSEMEGHFGASLDGVRVHTGGEADSLNRSLQAKAFTTGQDIFFRSGQYQPASDGGRRLLAHELTHVAQQRGAGAGVQRKGIIQRAVGFEFEAGNWTLYKLNAPLTKNQEKGVDQVPTTQLEDFGITKGASLYKGKDWDFTADHSEDMHVEFVTKSPGFQEGKSGRKKLVNAMKDMKSFGDKMVKSKSKAKVNVQGGMLSLPLRTIVSKAPKDILMTPRSNLDAEPQTTAGIRLSQLAQMMDNFYKGKFTNQSEDENQDRALGNQLLWGKQPRDQEVVGDSPDSVRVAWDFIVKKYKGISVAGFDEWPALSPSMIALASMIRSYLITADGTIAYAKSLAPLMARTDFGTIFNMIASEDADFMRAAPHIFVELILDSAGMSGTEDTPVFAGKATHIDPAILKQLRRMTRAYWIENVVDGTDYLTTENFPVEKVDEALFGLGGLGDKTDVVGGDKKGDEQYNAPVFEFRRMQGRIEHYAWPTLAEEIFDWISDVNQGSGAAFTGAKTREVRAGGGKKK